MTSLENENIVNLCLEYYLTTENKSFDLNQVLQAYGIIYIGKNFKINKLNILKSARKLFRIVDETIEVFVDVRFRPLL
jgi:hypothetical protein